MRWFIIVQGFSVDTGETVESRTEIIPEANERVPSTRDLHTAVEKLYQQALDHGVV